MWLYIVICGAVAYYPRDHDVLFVWMPVASVLSFLPSLHSVLSIHLSPLPCSPSGSRKKEDARRHLDCLFKRTSKLASFLSPPTVPVALDTGTAQRVLPPEIK